MQRSERFDDVRFPAAVIRRALEALVSIEVVRIHTGRYIDRGPSSLEFDTDEEFFAEYQRDFDSATFLSEITQSGRPGFTVLKVVAEERNSTVTIGLGRREDVDAVMNIFVERAVDSRLPPLPAPPPPPPPVVFIGHGHSSQWRDLKDHLHDLHGYDIEHFEVGARAGHAVRDILELMLGRSTFAVLVMTGEDEMVSGQLRPRENVVHEAGLFQGRMGFHRAILAVEEGVQPFSNMDGIQQLRYSKGNIREIFGDVLATLRREFDQPFK